MPERWSKTSTVPGVWAILEFFRRNLNDLLWRLVTMDETCLNHYDPETKQQSMGWRHSGSTRFFVIKSVYSSMIIFQTAKLSTRSIRYLCWYIWRIFKGKPPQEDHQGCLVLARQCPGSPGTCTPEATVLLRLPVSWSPSLFSGSDPGGLPPVPWTEKNLIIRYFSSDAEVIAAAGTWLDGQTSDFFLSALQRLEHGAKKGT